MNSEQIITFIKNNKILSFVGIIIIFAVILLVLNVLIQTTSIKFMSQTNSISDSATKGYNMGLSEESRFSGMVQTNAPTMSGSYVEVKEGSMTIETENAETDAEDIRALAESSDGYIEDLRKYEDSYNTNINIKVRVHESSFQVFVDNLKERYDDKSFSVSFYRVSTQRETGELEILSSAFTDYEELRDRTMKIALDENQINLLFRITEKELELKRLEKQYATSLSGKEDISEYSTINIVLQEKKMITVMPENLGDQLRLKVKNSLSNIANSLMDIVTGSITVLVSTTKYVIFFIFLAIPILIGLRILKRIYLMISKI
ncbi:MAG: DUF4349 domain-containing protein [DPANN group archaeon]|nr:DUF4349 domain-containing protein [DPANN group archaeon]